MGKSIINKFKSDYKKSKCIPIKFDFKREAIENLKLFNNSKINLTLHNFHSYPGRIFPYIPLFILSIKELHKNKSKLLDPFVGSGTVLVESLSNPLLKRDCYGVEINPVARLIAKVKTTPLEINSIEVYLKEIYAIYKEKKLNSRGETEIGGLEIWFSKNAIKKLNGLSSAIELTNIPTAYKDFFWGCFSNIIRKVSKADPFVPPPVFLKLEKYSRSKDKYDKLKKFLDNGHNPNVGELFTNTVVNQKDRILELNKLFNDKNSKNAKIIWDDSRLIKKGEYLEKGIISKINARLLRNESIDIIITSPPYLTAQKYIRSTKLELFWLGYDEKLVTELSRESIGSEHVSLNIDINHLDIPSIDKLINATKKKSKQRAATIYKYFSDMRLSIKEMYRVLKYDSFAFLIVGNNRVLDKEISTYKLLTDLATNEGFIEFAILKDEIKSRGMMTKRNGTGGLIKHEYVIILKKES